jgi:integrase
MAKRKKTPNIPGSIYKNGNRYWWKVQLPGEDEPKPRPLKPTNSSLATTDYCVAVECAKILLAQSMLVSKDKHNGSVETVGELVKVYLEHVDTYYRPQENGKPSKEATNIRYSIKPLIELFAPVGLESFGPLKLIEVRKQMIAEEIVRRTINQRIGRIKRMFRWGVTMQYVSPVIAGALDMLEGLRRGYTTAKEGKKVKPVNEVYVYRLLEYATPVVAAMIELQLLTGMRPGELVRLTPKEIDRSGEVWHYYPEKHKKEFRDEERIISIGPRAQEILRPFLLRPEDAYCFSPKESEQQRLAKLHSQRKIPLHYGNRPGTNRKESPLRQPGERFTSETYANSVRKAIKAARRDIQKNGGNPDMELPIWTVYQMRHTTGSKTRKMFNYETAGAVLGHNKMSATEIYAERNQELADEAMKKIG